MLKRVLGQTIIIILAVMAMKLTVGNVHAKSSSKRHKAHKMHRVYSAKSFFQTAAFYNLSYASNGEHLLLTANIDGQPSVYQMSTKTGQLDNLIEDRSVPVVSISWFPEDARLLFTQDKGGNEKDHIFVREVNGKLHDLTPGKKVKAKFLGWSRDKKTFWVTSNELHPKHCDLYEYQTEDYSRKIVFENSKRWDIKSISPNGRWIALSKKNSNEDSDIFLWDRLSPELEPFNIRRTNDNGVRYVKGFSGDSKKLIYKTNEGSEYSEIWEYDIDMDDHEPLVKADADALYLFHSPSGRYRVWALNRNSQTELHVLDLDTQRELDMTRFPVGQVKRLRFSPDERHVAFYLTASNQPSDLYLFDMQTKETKKLTDAFSGRVNEADLVPGVVQYFKSYDQLEVPGILYKPRSANANQPVPLLLWIHGGPGGQSKLKYNATIQYLVNHGYAIYCINHRGSGGYGKTFKNLDNLKHGQADLLDVVYAKKAFAQLDWVDGDKIGVMGGSYGGYLTASALAFYPDAFEVGIDMFGPTNWERTLANLPPWWEKFKNSIYTEMGDPAQHGERHRAISPLYHAQQIVKPLMVVQGANDPRVAQAESDELVSVVQSSGVPVEYLLFEDEGHGLRKKKNQIRAAESYLNFLDKYLKKTTVVATNN